MDNFAFRKDYLKYKEQLTLHKGLSEMLWGILKGIEAPYGYEARIAFSAGTGSRGIYISLNEWPMEMSCAFVAEFEALLDTEAAVEKYHFFGDEILIEYIFYRGTPMSFQICNFSAKGCRVSFEGQTSSRTVKRVECQ